MAEIDFEEKIASVEKKLKQLQAQKEALEAKKIQALFKGKKADDTRRKILLGALSLEMMANDDNTKQRIMKRLDSYLQRDDDRKLFDLEPLPKQKEQTETPAEKNHD